MDKKEIWSWIKSLALAIVLALIIRENVFAFYTVKGTSMLPTIEHGQLVVVNKIVYKLYEPQRGDIVVFPGERDDLIKRIIALPGDTVQITDGKVWVNGEALDEYYISVPTHGDMDPIYMQPSVVFVMGDNRNPSMSWDSRGFGPVEMRKILGRAEFIIFPLPHSID